VTAPDATADTVADASTDPKDVSSATEVGFSLGSCPTAPDDPTPKIGFAAYLGAAPTRVNAVTVWLRADALPVIPACPQSAETDARCPARDPALVERQRLNAHHIDCVLDGVGFRLSATPTWYETPYHLTSGLVVPVVLAFNVGLDWLQVSQVAANALVSRIDPPPGGALPTGFIPPVPADCPADVEATEAKLAGVASIDGQGRQPVVIETLDDGLLPPIDTCDGGAPCDSTKSLWERAVLNTREVTCIKRRLDQLVVALSPNVTYATLVGSPLSPSVPPLAQAARTLKAFGFGLTFDEARQLARHPYVERLWTAPAIQFEQTAPGCPPDLTIPIPEVACPTGSTPIAGKISDSDRILFSTGGTTLFDVNIAVAGGATYCPLDACSRNPCPSRDAVLARQLAENLASQRCVRELIATLGGTSSPEGFAISNFFQATLNWAQIQVVAAHPHVTSIGADVATPPP
jgi:hypothetical protein